MGQRETRVRLFACIFTRSLFACVRAFDMDELLRKIGGKLRVSKPVCERIHLSKRKEESRKTPDTPKAFANFAKKNENEFICVKINYEQKRKEEVE